MLPKGNFPARVYLNGEILPPERANISVFDRGFLFGDAIYEAMVQFQGGIFYKRAHWDRLQKNLEAIAVDFRVQDLDRALQPLLKASDLVQKDCFIYIQVSRGVAPRKHAFPVGTPPTAMMYALPLALPHIELRSLAAVTLADFRWHKCHIKSTSLLANVMANTSALRDDFDEAVLVREGLVTEGSHTNIFFVREGSLYTHPADHHILNGIARQIVLQLCRELDIPVVERAVALTEIAGMQEAFLTGTSTQIASLGQLDGHFYQRPGEIGPVTRRIQEAFAQRKALDTSELPL